MPIDSSSSEDDESEHFNHDSSLLSWVPRNILRRTNWLYCVDALIIHDIREMHNLWEICNLLKRYATQCITWAYSIKAFISTSSDNIVISKSQNILIIITKSLKRFGLKDIVIIWIFSG